MRYLLFFLPLLLFADTIFSAIYHPARLAFYTPYPSSKTISKKLLINLSETNNYEKKESYYLLDYELTTLTFLYEHPLSQKSSLRIILPIYHFWGGFLDNPLDAFHSATGSLHGYRHNQEGKNIVQINYGTFHKNSSFSTLGDMEVEYKYDFGIITLLTGIQLPTHQKGRLLHPKKSSYMIGAVFAQGPFTLNLHLTHSPKLNISTFARSRTFQYFTTLDYKRGHWLIEYQYASSPFRSSYPQFDSCSNIINLAYKYKKFTYYISENLSPFYNSADLTLGVIYKF